MNVYKAFLCIYFKVHVSKTSSVAALPSVILKTKTTEISVIMFIMAYVIVVILYSGACATLRKL